MSLSSKDIVMVPRVAESLADLRVGQQIAWNWREEGWSLHRVGEITPSYAWTTDGGGISPSTFDDGQVVILADPAPQPVIVPSELFDRLRVVAAWRDSGQASEGEVLAAVRALVASVGGAA